MDKVQRTKMKHGNVWMTASTGTARGTHETMRGTNMVFNRLEQEERLTHVGMIFQDQLETTKSQSF